MSAAGLVGALLLLAALSTSRQLQRFRSTLWVVHLTTSGYLFVLVGYLLGLTRPAMGNPEFHPELLPVISMISGWIGFSVGMAFHARVLRPLPWRAFAIALSPAVITVLAVGLVSVVVLWLWGMQVREALACSALLAAAAATSAPTLAAALRRRTRASRSRIQSNLRMIEFSAGMDVAVALLAGVLAFAFFGHGEGGLSAPLWFLTTLATGVAVGVLTWLFLGAPLSDDERLLLGIGMIAFGAGFGGWLNLSPTVIGSIAGVVLVNLPGDRMALLRRALAKVERPALVILLAILGYYIAGVFNWMMLVLIPLLTAGRAALKIGVTKKIHGEIVGVSGLRTGPGWGMGLISQGHLGPVLALGLVMVWQSEEALGLLAAVGIAGVINEFAAPFLMRRLLDGKPAPRGAPAPIPGGPAPQSRADSGALLGPSLTGEFRRAVESAGLPTGEYERQADQQERRGDAPTEVQSDAPTDATPVPSKSGAGPDGDAS